jgi:hypothetical protein
MKIKMPSGVILECENNDINEARLLAGGVEVIEQPKETPKKKSTKQAE